MVKVVLEFDDLHHHTHVDCLPVIESLVKRHPQIKLNFFVPTAYSNMHIALNKEWCNKLREYIDSGNVCLGVHGCTHSFLEFKHLDYADASLRITLSETLFEQANLPFLKAFRAPYWGINEATYDALLEKHYTHIYSHLDYKDLNNKYSDKCHVVYYNWNLKDEYPTMEYNVTNGVIIAHGHTSRLPELSCGNSIHQQEEKISAWIEQYNPEFLTLTEIGSNA